jgi:S-formylglutathione hydrolase FrmB
MTAVSLIGGWLPHVVGAGAALLMFGASKWRSGRWRSTIFAALSWLALVWAVQWTSGGAVMGTALPLSVYLFAGLPLLGLLLAGTNWRRAGWRRRGVALAAVPLLALTSLLGLNRWFGYYPTVESVLAGPPPTLSSHTTQLLPVRRMSAADRLRTGTVVTLDLPARRSHFRHRDAQAWLPPAWSLVPRPQLPVLVLLHGSPGAPDDWVRAGGAAKVANTYAAAHAGMAPVIVFPDANGKRFADTECVNGPAGQAETYLSVDVPKAIVRLLGASSDPSRWAIGGLSEGGTCALTLTLRHPAVYRTFVDLSGDLAPNLGGRSKTLLRLYARDRLAMAGHDPVALLSTQRFPKVSGWFEAGARDRHAQTAIRKLAPLALKAGIDVTVVTRRPGQHNFHFWAAALADSFDWTARKVRMQTAAYTHLSYATSGVRGAEPPETTGAHRVMPAKPSPDRPKATWKVGVSGR